MVDQIGDSSATDDTPSRAWNAVSALRFERLSGPALWLVVLILAATALLWRLDIQSRLEPPYLNLVLQVAMVGVSSLVAAALAMLGFRRAGNWPLLWLGAGSLVYGLGTSLSTSFLQWASSNSAVTTANLTALVASSLHVLGAFFLYSSIAPRQGTSGRRATLLQVYVSAVACVILIVVIALRGLLPPFFVQGQGGTTLRELVVVGAGLMFCVAGLAFLAQYRRTKAEFLYWYALGLLLNGLVQVSTFLTKATGTPLSWTARLALAFGGLFLLIAVLVTLREARARNLSSAEALASFFWHDEASLKLLFESIMDAIIVTDPRFIITDWNQAAEAAYGWKTAEVVGKRVADVLPTTYASDMDQERARSALLSAGTWRGEVLQRHRDGREIPVLATVSALRDESGRVMGVVALNRDITERKLFEDQLRESEAKTRDLIRYAPSGIYEVDFRTGRFRSINDAMCEVLGHTRDELFAMTAFDLLDDEGKVRFADRIRRTLAGEQVDPSVEYRVIKKDGTTIYAVLSVKITYQGGQPDGALVIAHDVTERRHAAEQLRLAAETLERRVQERTAELAASHEQLKNLSRHLVKGQEDERRVVANELYNDEGQRLAALLLELGLMQKEANGSRALMDRIVRMTQLADGVLFDMHSLAVNLRPASLDRLGLIPALHAYAEEFGRQHDLSVQVELSGLTKVQLDPDTETMLYRIAQEAVTNAIRHSHAGQIGIVATQHEDRLVLVIEDDGQGFDVEEATRCGGLGIVGMRERTEMLGGKLTIESTPGSGSSVYIEVPCKP